jgi:formamidopyrimidine-DNA glycosylase
MHVCQTAVDALGDSNKFPDEWLFNHRWGKGKKDAATTLPNGAKITFLTVGGRTSCVVPSVQKKTGAVAGDLKTEEKNDASSEETKPKGKTSKKRKAGKEDAAEDVEMEPEASKKVNGKARGKKSDVADAVKSEEEPIGQAKKRKATSASGSASASAKPSITEPAKKDPKFIAGRHRSGRVPQK